jgi:hypothetical protein
MKFAVALALSLAVCVCLVIRETQMSSNQGGWLIACTLIGIVFSWVIVTLIEIAQQGREEK